MCVYEGYSIKKVNLALEVGNRKCKNAYFLKRNDGSFYISEDYLYNFPNLLLCLELFFTGNFVYF